MNWKGISLGACCAYACVQKWIWNFSNTIKTTKRYDFGLPKSNRGKAIKVRITIWEKWKNIICLFCALFSLFGNEPRRHLAVSTTHTHGHMCACVYDVCMCACAHAYIVSHGNNYFPFWLTSPSQPAALNQCQSSRGKRLGAVSLVCSLGH